MKWLRFASSASFVEESAEESILTLPTQYLRMADPSNCDKVTLQRNDVLFDTKNGKPIQRKRTQVPPIRSYSLEGDIHRIVWEDGVVTTYPSSWVEEQLNDWNKGSTGRILWENCTEEELRSSRSLHFDDILAPEGQSRGLRALYEYGILLVTGTPIHDNGAGVAALASALGGGSVKTNPTTILNNYLAGGSDVSLPKGTDGPLRTLYGKVWSTTSSDQAEGTSIADSAYGYEALPLHNDMCYLRDTCGLQIFTMVQPAVTGGESVFADGFAAAERLRTIDAKAFDTLSKTMRRYRCIDQETGWHLEASGPVISLKDDRVAAIRHNDLDRLPDLPPQQTEDVDAFYDDLQDAHEVWDSILGMDDIRLVVQLQAGDTVVVANQVSCFVHDTDCCHLTVV
jgi:hypothetical protein